MFLAETPLYKDLPVHIVTVAKGQDETTAEELLKPAVTTLEEAGMHPTSYVLHGNPEDAIVDYAITHEIDSLLMGAYGHNRIRHLLIGSTTTQMLLRSHIPVLLYR